MSLGILQTYTAIAPGLQASFLGSGGTSPYSYSMMPGGAGGSINSSGIYTAPATVNDNAALAYDWILVRDNAGASATTKILIAYPIGLFCDILQNQMGLEDGRVYFWDQKIFQPTDDGLYIAVSIPNCKPFGNNTYYDDSLPGFQEVQIINMQAVVDVDIISRGPAARDQKELILAALNSTYAEQQQEKNSFYISRLPSASRFINLSDVDGAAIPYRYKISFAMQYAVKKTANVDYFDQFQNPSVTADA